MTTDTEKAYAGGILDGEGSISMTRVGGKKNDGKAYWRIVVAVTNCDEGLIRWLQDRWRGSVLWNLLKGENHRPQNAWKIVGRQAAAFLEDVQPFVVIKTDRVKWALEVADIQGKPREPFGRR